MSDRPFRFRLQRVLEVRSEAERVAQRTLAAAVDEAATARELREAMAAIRDAGEESLARVQALGPTAGALRTFAFVQGRIEERVALATASLAQKETRVDATRAELVEAFLARSVVDRLRERQHEQWREDATRADRRQMDEVALVQHGRARRSGGVTSPEAASSAPTDRTRTVLE